MNSSNKITLHNVDQILPSSGRTRRQQGLEQPQQECSSPRRRCHTRGRGNRLPLAASGKISHACDHPDEAARESGSCEQNNDAPNGAGRLHRCREPNGHVWDDESGDADRFELSKSREINHISELEVQRLPKQSRKDIVLPEPALTTILPVARSRDMPSAHHDQLITLLAVAEQQLSALIPKESSANGHQRGTLQRRGKQVPAALPLRQSCAGTVKDPQAGGRGIDSLDENSFIAPILPGLKNDSQEGCGFHDVMIRKLPSLGEVLEKAMTPSRAYDIIRSGEKPQQTGRNRVYQTNTSGRFVTMKGDRNGGNNVRRTLDIEKAGRNKSSQHGSNTFSTNLFQLESEGFGTRKNVNPARFVYRGPANGFISIAERVQADMPSPSISHFSIVRRSKAADGQDAAIATPMVRQLIPQPFNIFQEFLKRPELTFTLAKHFRVQELITLYSISRAFHNIINMRFTTVILSQSLARAPESSRIFPFRCYARLCMKDPASRLHPIAHRAAEGERRTVPSFRWLLMVCFREMVCHEIMAIMAEDGVPMPERCEMVMKKIWFIMDIPDNRRRIGMIQNPEIFTNVDLFFATMFFVKMDMRFTDPITGSGKDGMRRLLLSQPSLSMVWRTLKRTALISKLDVMKLFVRWKYQPQENERGQSIFGIPPDEIGIAQYEGWGRTGSRVKLERPDELILKETVRRNLNLHEKYTDIFLWGYINPRTLQNFPAAPYSRRLPRLEHLEDVLTAEQDKGQQRREKMVSRRIL